MKKLVCIAAALMCVAGMAAAEEYIPSKTAADMTRVVIATELPEAQDAVSVYAIVNADEMNEADKTVYQKEIEKLKANPEAYFADVKNPQGDAVSLKTMLDAEKVNVHEMCMLDVKNYDVSYGSMTLEMYFSTPYQPNESVIVVIGLVNDDQSIQWTAYEGRGIEEGGLSVELDAQMLEAVQNGTALLAVVSK